MTFPLWYLVYSRTKATAPIPAKAKKTKPVTSNQSCPRTRLKCWAVPRAAPQTAVNVRVFWICRPATRVTMPILRAVETFIIFVDFIKLQGYNSAEARSFVTKHCDGRPHLKIGRWFWRA